MVGLQVLVLAIGVRIPVPERAIKNTLLGVFLCERRGSEASAYFASGTRKSERCVSFAHTVRLGQSA